MISMRKKKIRVAIIYGYNGRPFHGSQKAIGVPTVEEELEKAIFAAGLVSQSNFGNLNKMGWNRASRTDKGVHAAQNVIKCNLEVGEEFFGKNELKEGESKKNCLLRNEMIKELNSKIHPDLKVFGIKLVTKNFNAKNSASSRKYEYLIPLSILKNGSDKFKTDLEVLERVN